MTRYKDTPPQDDSLTVNLGEAARLLGVSPFNARNLAQRGKLPGAIKVGKLWRVSKKRLMAFVDGEAETN